MTATKIRSSAQLYVDADLDLNSKKITGLATPTSNTDAATKAYVDGILGANDAMIYKGVIDCSADPNYPAGNAGDTYKISVAGTIGGVFGTDVAVGDLVICNSDNTSTGNQATVGANWDVIHATAEKRYMNNETVTGDKDGVNDTFFLANTPVLGSVTLYLNGMLLNPGAGNDYTIADEAITMATPPLGTDVLLANYR